MFAGVEDILEASIGQHFVEIMREPFPGRTYSSQWRWRKLSASATQQRKRRNAISDMRFGQSCGHNGNVELYTSKCGWEVTMSILVA